VAKALAPVHVGQVYFDERNGHGGQCVAQRDAGMRQRAGVDDDELRAVEPCRVQPIDQTALVVALEGLQRDPESGRDLGQLALDVGECAVAGSRLPSKFRFGPLTTRTERATEGSAVREKMAEGVCY